MDGFIDCVKEGFDKLLNPDDAIRLAANNHAARHNSESVGARLLTFPLKGVKE
jgi:hypothetical protein